MFDHILFDLDGTLTDPIKGILCSLRHTLARFNIEEEDEERLRLFIGPPLFESFRTLYGFNQLQTDEAIRHYREHHAVDGLYDNKVFAGIPELLEELKGNGKRLYVATTKMTSFAEEILDHFDMKKYFSMIVGGNPDGTRTAKQEIIAEILTETGDTAGNKIVMIGDRKYDIIGAKAHGLTAVGVTYGYGSEEELRAQKPDYLVHSVAELSSLLLGDA
ncbi:MAG: HAD-IA family hydrolase [Bacillota bacterium]|nr:HAD-IA family hydrolase [Bacillota bacterium]MDW7683680.1 HAD-IA family hydrolase [Bacillota bacterium]